MEKNATKREIKKIKKRNRRNKLWCEITLHSKRIKKENRIWFSRKHEKNSPKIYRTTSDSSWLPNKISQTFSRCYRKSCRGRTKHCWIFSSSIWKRQSSSPKKIPNISNKFKFSQPKASSYASFRINPRKLVCPNGRKRVSIRGSKKASSRRGRIWNVKTTKWFIPRTRNKKSNK